MNYRIDDTQLFSLLDSVFPDLSVKKIRSRNSAHTYIIESNDNEMFHYENGSLNVNPDFIESLKSFIPIKIDKGIMIIIAKWIRSKTGLKARNIWVGMEGFNTNDSLDESQKKELKRFDRGLVKDYGKYGEKIELLANLYVKDMGQSICDLVCLCSEINGKETYVILIIASHYLSSDFETKLTNHITSFIPVDIWVLVNVVHGCNQPD